MVKKNQAFFFGGGGEFLSGCVCGIGLRYSVLRERMRARGIWAFAIVDLRIAIEKQSDCQLLQSQIDNRKSQIQITLTPALSRSTGRGGMGMVAVTVLKPTACRGRLHEDDPRAAQPGVGG